MEERKVKPYHQGRASRARSTSSRTIFRIALGLVVLAGLYLLVGNLALRPGLRSLADEMDVAARHSKAYTLYPGHLHFKDLRITARSGSAWTLALDRADLRVDILALLRGRLRISRLRGAGLEADLAAHPQELARAPEPRAQPLVRGSILPDMREPRAGVRARTLRIEDVNIDARTLGAGPHQLDGVLHARAAWIVAGRTTLAMGPVTLDIAEGQLRHGQLAVANALRGRVEGRLDALDPSLASGRDALGAANGRIELAGDIVSVGALLPFGAASLDSIPGTLKANVTLDRGVVAKGSEVIVDAGSPAVEQPERATAALPSGLTLIARRSPSESPTLQLEVSIPKLIPPEEHADVSAGVMEDVHLEFDAPGADLSLPWSGDGTLRASVGRGRWPAGAVTLVGKANLRLALRHMAPAAGAARIESGEIEAREVTVEPAVAGEAPPRAPMEGKIRIDGGMLSAREGASFHGGLLIQGSDAGALLDLAGVTGSLRWTLAVAEARPFTLSSSVTRRDPVLRLDDVRFESGYIVATGAFHEGSERHGAFLVAAGPLSAGLSVEAGHPEVTLSPPQGWLARRLDALAGP
jgi:hypothetical protein